MGWGGEGRERGRGAFIVELYFPRSLPPSSSSRSSLLLSAGVRFAGTIRRYQGSIIGVQSARR